MSQKQIDLSKDLKKLQNEGYEIEVKDGYGILSHIPYLNESGEIELGTLISSINFQGDVAQYKYNSNHVINFAGKFPCELDGTPIAGIKHDNKTMNIAGIEVNYQFSNKPAGNYKDYYEKFVNYAKIISHPAIEKDPTQTARTFNKVVTDEESVFEYVDTNSSRAEIDNCNLKIKGQNVAIIGLGGTGSYILDLVSKTSVKEIHIFDGDIFNQHNAFRTPGATAKELFLENINKTSYLKNIYKNMHKRIIEHNEYINEDNVNMLQKFDFVFISIDSGESRKLIIDVLVKNEIPFIDAGMGIIRQGDSLRGQLRVSLFDITNYKDIPQHVDFSEDSDDVYNTNIQIAELNALNATMAVIKWKQYFKVYMDNDIKHQSIYVIEEGEIIHED